MKLALKIAIYCTLAALASYSLQGFFGAWSAKMEAADHRFDGVDEIGSAPAVGVRPDAGVDEPGTDAGTNGLALTDTNVAAIEGTNLVETGTTDTPGDAGKGAAGGLAETRGEEATATAGSMMGLYGALALVSVLGFAGLLAHDVSHYLAQRAHRSLYNEDAEGVADPVYDEAEKVWANGDHLEAIRLLREFLKKNPRGVHAAFRIAEIYEKDLRNELAAALEYEEILKHKLDAERWGWAAVHLCNLYYHMEQPAKAEALLQRLVDEYGHTAAAKKARKRLGLPEIEDGETEAEATPGMFAPEMPAETSHLPRGFRPK